MTEYVRCPLCGAWAKAERKKDRDHRDRLICYHCGMTMVSDDISSGKASRFTAKEHEKK